MSEKNDTKKRNNRHYYWLSGIAIFTIAIITVFTFFQSQVDSKIENHPKVVTMEVNQKNMEKALGEIRDELKELNRKMDKLLRDEYIP